MPKATRQVKRTEPKPGRFTKVKENETTEGVKGEEIIETIEEPVVINATTGEINFDIPEDQIMVEEAKVEVLEVEKLPDPEPEEIKEPEVKKTPQPQKQNIPWYINRAMGIDDYYNW